MCFKSISDTISIELFLTNRNYIFFDSRKFNREKFNRDLKEDFSYEYEDSHH